MKETCVYCKQPIDTDEPGWGYDAYHNSFHSECLQMYEGVEVPA